MPAYLVKNRDEILRKAINKIERDTPLSATAPGSIVRALTEVFTRELGDMYDLLDFNLSQQFITTASGSALDMLGSLYGVTRKNTSTLTTIDKAYGAFLFYMDSAYGSNIVIPKGTKIYTDATTFIGAQYSYVTTEDAIIPTGRRRAFVSIKPNFTDSVFTAGPGTLVVHDFQSPANSNVKCTNPKSIQAQIGYEEDESYRFRIIKTMRVNAGGTAEAVRFAGLAVPGVRDIRIRQAPYGLGSFEVIVIPEDYSNANAIVERVSASVEGVRPLGVRAYFKKPTTRTVDFSFDLIIPASNSSNVVESAQQRARVAAARYIGSLLPGDTLVYNRLVQAIMDSSDLIRDVLVKKFTVGGVEVARRNYQPEPDTQLVPGSLTASIARA